MWDREHLAALLERPVIGMVHLPALPGAPGWSGSLDAVRRFALDEAEVLQAGGVGALMVENYHDVPFHAGSVPAHTVAAMTVILRAVRDGFPGLPCGVNVLRNDGAAALAVALATGASFIRVNVLSGAVVTDQRLIQGRADRLLRLRRELGVEVGILADVRVKHGRPLGSRPLIEEALDLRQRCLADGLILTGEATGAAADPDEMRRVREALPDCPLLVGSGMCDETVREFADWADGYIVGTSLKSPGPDGHPVTDRRKVASFLDAVATARKRPG